MYFYLQDELIIKTTQFSIPALSGAKDNKNKLK